jgi:hypothetical protein
MIVFLAGFTARSFNINITTQDEQHTCMLIEIPRLR